MSTKKGRRKPCVQEFFVYVAYQAFEEQGLPHGPSPHFAAFTFSALIIAGFLYSIPFPSLSSKFLHKQTRFKDRIHLKYGSTFLNCKRPKGEIEIPKPVILVFNYLKYILSNNIIVPQSI